MRTMKLGLLLAMIAGPLSAQNPAAPQKPTAAAEQQQLALGRQLSQWFLSGQMDSIAARMPDDVREKSGGVSSLQKSFAELSVRAGEESKLLEEKMTRRRGLAQYWRSAMFTNFNNEPIVLRWLFDDSMKVTGMGLGPLSQTPKPDGE